MSRLGRTLVVATMLAGSCRCAVDASTPPAFRTVAPGLEVASVEAHGTTFHLVRVDLAKNRLAVVDARRDDRQAATVDELREESGALAAINGTFFDEKRRPLGLVVTGGREVNRLHRTSWFAALVVEHGAQGDAARVMTTSELDGLGQAGRSQLVLALQAGPRTVEHGRPLALKNQAAERSAVCLQSPTKVVLVATENSPVEATELASLMAARESAGGFGCDAGMLLDGGPSTQLSVHAPGYDLDVPGGWPVPNALVVLAR